MARAKSRLQVGWIETGCLHAYWMYTSRWSCMLAPMPGKSATTSMLVAPGLHARLRFRLVPPGLEAVANGKHERSRHVYEDAQR